MAAAQPRVTLVVKHLPPELNEHAVTELLAHYGAVEVRLMKPGPLGGVAFAVFPDAAASTAARQQLHGMQVLGKQLVVEVAKRETAPAPPKPAQQQTFANIAPQLGIHYPMPPDLQYAYPEPTEEILENIKRAMMAVPKLYTQVLHLMNKMNLPVPFGRELPMLRMKRRRSQQKARESESESELSSEEESTTTTKKQELVVPVSSAPAASAPKLITPTAPTAPTPVLPEPTPAASAERNVISLAQLTALRMSLQELHALPVFAKAYEPGEPHSKLYIKNLGKSVTEDDLRYVFGRYFDSDEEAEALTVQLMAGKMKGQAFVTFPSVDQAVRALSETHGVRLGEKPMYVVFGKKTSE